jgi:hypothetical protein
MKTGVEWLQEEYDNNPESFLTEDDFNQAKEIEKEKQEVLLNYIQEVRDLCGKLYFPTEGELRELTNKADGILNQFKQQ